MEFTQARIKGPFWPLSLGDFEYCNHALSLLKSLMASATVQVIGINADF